jgi:hypothetical protein
MTHISPEVSGVEEVDLDFPEDFEPPPDLELPTRDWCNSGLCWCSVRYCEIRMVFGSNQVSGMAF